MPVLGYLDFSHPFELEMDAVLQGFGAVLSKRDENGQSKAIAYASQALYPSEKKKKNCSLAKLELLCAELGHDGKIMGLCFGIQIDHVHG